MNYYYRREIKKLFLFLQIILLLILILGLFSCKKNTSVGLNTLPFPTYYTDTFSVFTYTTAEDSVRSDEVLSTIPFGNILNDPFFGSSSASLVSQFLLPNDNFSFGNTPTLDSVVLSIAYSGGTYGNINDIQNIEVYSLVEDITYNTNYYSNYPVKMGSLIGSGQVVINTTDSVRLGNSNFAPHFRIKLNPSFGNLILNGGVPWIDHPTFLQHLKGIYVKSKTNSGTGAYTYIDLTNPTSGITVYYNQGNSVTFSMYANNVRAAARFSLFSHSFTNSINNSLLNKYHHDTCYIQSLSGTKLLIEIPNLINLYNQNKGKNIVIHGASISVKSLTGSNINSFEFPERLLLARRDSLGRNRALADEYYSQNNSHLGGFYNLLNGYYSYQCLHEMQRIFTEFKSSPNLIPSFYFIIPTGLSKNANRLVVDTRQGYSKLMLTYSLVD